MDSIENNTVPDYGQVSNNMDIEQYLTDIVRDIAQNGQNSEVLKSNALEILAYADTDILNKVKYKLAVEDKNLTNKLERSLPALSKDYPELIILRNTTPLSQMKISDTQNYSTNPIKTVEQIQQQNVLKRLIPDNQVQSKDIRHPLNPTTIYSLQANNTPTERLENIPAYIQNISVPDKPNQERERILITPNPYVNIPKLNM